MKLEIGCQDGRQSAGRPDDSEFIHCDLEIFKHVEVVCDGQYLPFKDSTFEYIVMWGVFEHFTYNGARKVLVECRRVLTDNGRLELTIPDLRGVCKILVENKLPFNIEMITKPDTPSSDVILNYVIACLYGNQKSDRMMHKAGWTKELAEEFFDKAELAVELFDGEAYEPKTHLHYILRRK